MAQPSVVCATKKIPLCEDEEEEVYTTELIVLSECRHPNVIKLLDSYLHIDNIYVSNYLLICELILFHMLSTMYNYSMKS